MMDRMAYLTIGLWQGRRAGDSRSAEPTLGEIPGTPTRVSHILPTTLLVKGSVFYPIREKFSVFIVFFAETPCQMQEDWVK